MGPELLGALFPAAPNLYVLGHFESDGGAYPLVSKQAELVALLARADAMRQWLARLTSEARPDLSGGVRYVQSMRHANYAQFETYEAYLARLIKRARRELSKPRNQESGVRSQGVSG